LIIPNPYIRPLEHKLVPRPEPPPVFHQAQATPDLSYSDSPRDDTSPSLNGGMMEEGVHEAPKLCGTSEETTKKIKAVIKQRPVGVVLAHQLDIIARTAALDSDATPKWRAYMDCYSKVRVHLNDLHPTTCCLSSFCFHLLCRRSKLTIPGQFQS
jgi:hypothetical protein